MKEPEIKLFGRKILLPDNGAVEEPSGQTDGGSGGAVDGEERGKADDEKQLPDEEDEKDISSEVDENAKSGSWMEEEEERNGEQKQLKKPDIFLPCPRCNSMDTKFCYYNNYNVNQPRHFCKGCQRYWTAGGTMRNVPVGAGRRKNKNSHPHHITQPALLSFKTMDDNSVQKPDDGNMPRAPYPVPGMAWWTPAVPMPFYPNPYWNCGVPWGSPNALGKHSRNGELIRPNSECSIVVPKTMRIDDLEEDAKTSIWEALGINHDRVSRGLFKALQPKNDDKKPTLSASSVLQANPTALSRSINFQETA